MKHGYISLLTWSAQIEFNVQDDRGYTVLHLAAAEPNSAELISALMTSKLADSTLKDLNGYSPLHVAVMRGSSTWTLTYYYYYYYYYSIHVDT